jgi:hypothetical protein
MTSVFHFDWGGAPYLGGPNSAEFDYQEIGEILSTYIRKDYTFIHPEALDEKCRVVNGLITLENEVNFESYKLFILPGSSTMSISNAKKLREFYLQGGTIIATSMLAFKSLEKGKEEELREILYDIFGDFNNESNHCKGHNGKAHFIENLTKEILKEIIEKSPLIFDVEIKTNEDTDGVFSYIHKVKDGTDIYYFVNCSDKDIKSNITINGLKDFEIWNPHNDERSTLGNIKYNNGMVNFELMLKAVSSVFLVSK